MKKLGFLPLLAAILLVSCSSTPKNSEEAKYVFYFIGDGMGAAIVRATEIVKSIECDSTYFVNFSKFPAIGTATTSSANSYITDSAAAGTALAGGKKTNNGMLGIEADSTTNIIAISTKAKAAGKGVAILTSVSIDHATPASFYAHNISRNNYYEIAMEGATSNFDILGGSGFKDARENLFPTYINNGYTLLRGKEQILSTADTLSSKMVLMEVAEGSNSSLAAQVDRTEADLTLTNLLKVSIENLYKKYKEQGFFIMAEGGMIDWSGHDNDFYSAMGEVVDLEQSVAVALEFYKKHPEQTLIVVTADHETGGFGLGTTKSQKDLQLHKAKEYSSGSFEKVAATLSQNSKDGVKFSDIEAIKRAKLTKDEHTTLSKLYKQNPKRCAKVLTELINNKIGAGWTTDNHTGCDVMVYAIGVGAKRFATNQDNTAIPHKIEQIMGKTEGCIE